MHVNAIRTWIISLGHRRANGMCLSSVYSSTALISFKGSSSLFGIFACLAWAVNANPYCETQTTMISLQRNEYHEKAHEGCNLHARANDKEYASIIAEGDEFWAMVRAQVTHSSKPLEEVKINNRHSGCNSPQDHSLQRTERDLSRDCLDKGEMKGNFSRGQGRLGLSTVRRTQMHQWWNTTKLRTRPTGAYRWGLRSRYHQWAESPTPRTKWQVQPGIFPWSLGEWVGIVRRGDGSPLEL